MEGKLKSQGDKQSEIAKDAQPRGLPETVFQTAELMGRETEMQQPMPGVSYDSMPTNDPIMLPVTNMAPIMMPDSEFVPQVDLNLDQSFSWEMIGLGLEEPMPTQEAIDELYDFRPPVSDYANKIKEHRSFSIKYIHRCR